MCSICGMGPQCVGVGLWALTWLMWALTCLVRALTCLVWALTHLVWASVVSTLKCSPSHMQDIKQELQAISSSDPVEGDCFVDVMSVSVVPSEHKGNSVVVEEILEVGKRGEWSTTK